jgi:hypothetical protein
VQEKEVKTSYLYKNMYDSFESTFIEIKLDFAEGIFYMIKRKKKKKLILKRFFIKITIFIYEI